MTEVKGKIQGMEKTEVNEKKFQFSNLSFFVFAFCFLSFLLVPTAFVFLFLYITAGNVFI